MQSEFRKPNLCSDLLQVHSRKVAIIYSLSLLSWPKLVIWKVRKIAAKHGIIHYAEENVVCSLVAKQQGWEIQSSKGWFFVLCICSTATIAKWFCREQMVCFDHIQRCAVKKHVFILANQSNEQITVSEHSSGLPGPWFWLHYLIMSGNSLGKLIVGLAALGACVPLPWEERARLHSTGALWHSPRLSSGWFSAPSISIWRLINLHL